MDQPYVLARQPEYIATWMDADGRPGRGFRFLEEFYLHYELVGMVRMDGAEVTQERFLTLPRDATDRSVVALIAGQGRVPGLYLWGLWSRTGEPEAKRALRASDFSTRLDAKGVLGVEGNILVAPAEHPASHVLFGPFLQLDPGRYVGKLEIQWDYQDREVDRLCSFEVFDGTTVQAEQTLLGNRPPRGGENVFFDFYNAPRGAEDRRFEFRLWCWGNAEVRVHAISLWRTGEPPVPQNLTPGPPSVEGGDCRFLEL
jgi:hypothetical protein